MKRNVIIISALAAAIVLIAALVISRASQPMTNMNMSSTKSGTLKPADDHSVIIQNYTFSPSPLKVKRGTTVTWTNADTARHSVIADDGQPAGGPNGPLIAKNASYQFTFMQVGTYKYHCGPHPYMHGVVEVTE